MAARSEEEAKSIATTQAVILVELHAVKNRYGALSAGAGSPPDSAPTRS